MSAGRADTAQHGYWTRYKLWLIRRLLWWADAVICSLPTPAKPRGDYFDTWGRLGSVHGAIDRAYQPATRERDRGR